MYRYIFVLFFIVLVGCDKSPKCSDPDVLDTVKSIISDEDRELLAYVEIETLNEESYNPETGKRECSASFKPTNKSIQLIKHYSSQELDSVSRNGIENILNFAIALNLETYSSFPFNFAVVPDELSGKFSVKYPMIQKDQISRFSGGVQTIDKNLSENF